MPTRKNIIIVDYHLGNLGSVYNALGSLGFFPKISNQADDIKQADILILPGVGAFGHAMHNIRELRLERLLKHEIQVKGKPVLGVCLGMQIMAKHSEESPGVEGFGFIDAEVIKIAPSESLPVPHVGWNNINIHQPHPLFDRVDNNCHYYFDHSYCVSCDHAIVSATVDYGGSLVAGFQLGSIYGVQFHPEISQRCGLKLYRSFIESYA